MILDTTALDLRNLKDFPREVAYPFCTTDSFQRIYSNTTTSGEAFVLRPGLGFARLHLRAHEKTKVKLWLPDNLAYLCFNHSGELNFILPDLGHQTLCCSQWGILTGTQVEFSYAKGAEVSLLLFVIEKTLLRKFVELSNLSLISLLYCFSCSKAVQPIFLKGESSKELKLLAEIILHKKDNQDIHRRLSLESHCLEWISAFLQQSGLKKRRECMRDFNHADIKALKAVASYLESNLTLKHSLSDLSRRFHLNEFKLKRGFKELYGTTVFAYLRRKRMQFAKMALRRNDYSVIEVANVVGYTNPSHFAQAFKEHFGILPSAYRYLNKGANRGFRTDTSWSFKDKTRIKERS